MSGWHPQQADGGALPNPQDPNNPTQALAPVNPPILTAPLYYGNGCDVRLRPHVINTLISENLALVDSVGMNYNPSSLRNLRTATEYVVQKGLPKLTMLTASGVPTNYYTGGLSPPLLGGYNNGMILCVIPNATNQGFVRIDVGGGWWVPVLREDRQELSAEDWPVNVPQIIAYFNGAFYMLGIAKSQVPIILKGAIFFWIRPDGNDTTGDGTENTPGKAFRTITGCWAAVGSRFSASPTSAIYMMLGIPGDYEGGSLGPYGATVVVMGNRDARQAYRIHALDQPPGSSSCIYAGGINSFLLQGVTLVMDVGANRAYGNRGITCSRSNITVDNIEIVLAVDHPNASNMISVEFGSIFGEANEVFGSPRASSDIRFIGNGARVSNAFQFMWTATMTGSNPLFYQPNVWYFENINFTAAAFNAHSFCTFANSNRNWINAGCTGQRYSATWTSNMGFAGQTPPGDLAGAYDATSTVTP